MLYTTAVTSTPTPPPSAPFSLAGRDEYGPILGRPGGLFTAPAVLVDVGGARGPLERPPTGWVPREHLL